YDGEGRLLGEEQSAQPVTPDGDPAGRDRRASAPGREAPAPSANRGEPYRYTARAYDAESPLRHHRARQYDPSPGGWLLDDAPAPVTSTATPCRRTPAMPTPGTAWVSSPASAASPGPPCPCSTAPWPCAPTPPASTSTAASPSRPSDASPRRSPASSRPPTCS